MASYKLNNIIIPEELPLIALKNTVLLPKIVIPLIVQRPKSVTALEYAMAHDRLVFFVTQKNIEDNVRVDDLFKIGTIGRVVAVFKLPDGSSKIDVEGLARAKISGFTTEEPFFKVNIKPFPTRQLGEESLEEKALTRLIIDQFRTVSELKSFPSISPEIIYMMSQLKDTDQVISLITANLNLEIQDQQLILETENQVQALQKLHLFLTREIEILEAEKMVAKETKKQIGKMQKELFLREQLKSIEKELGVDDEKDEMNVIKSKVEAAGMPKETRDKALKELNRLIKMPPFNPEASYLRTYLDWLVELPWSKKAKEKIDLKEAEKILNQDHYGLTKVKERILEYLAVQKQVGKLKGPILCLVGPPGTGKTSIGQSIARALGRKFIRVSLGGLRDEAEIRGHRRTYVGALPGRIIQGIHTAGVKNPVFMLDEIDKLGMDFRGDPSSALLEALDPQQNNSFSDHYLEAPFDLSDVMFVTTANILETIPPALRDRLEIIHFPGYTEQEKFHIAKNFLIPKLFKDHGLKKRALSLSDSGLMDIVQNHTREAGVRELERHLASVIRKVTRKLVEAPSHKQITITKETIHKYLGPAKYSHQVAETKDEIGVVTGLGWTPVGGEVFSIEVVKMPGRGRLNLTGQLGSVMKESAQAGLSFARAYSLKYGVKEDFNKDDIHIHVPSGAIRKDGPSAGIAMTTALVSLFLKKEVRKEVCMTGEVTLRGKVLEIGGIKEKILAAHRAGLKVVILPAENKKDMEDIPKEIRRDMKFYFAKTMEDVLKIALK
ncbi:MAG: endopeptidase La [Candidatus Yanofskybacteria bacterium RIFCSPHIGHO2_02_FULL_41_29]|uniref:Lon protease n=1 Tax=Candidatus Yanofskybacteria bacterium RIFCSPHIGHO2_01_FULL_41_53 TaxID=1802663 RepID=A0A1F8EM73_9BACT|nr:MAG: endopeptidase La [Candidatus Yanofskybacteria bacterium RIFCSPHIGHO2_01_FULL_41_53]OGN12285.1 MAG: endopeptidase La [Candidatus Yanofskybacteria bacterium RIFCSPHIGHO2_02_FULL_41_29]OGN17022.1 MAG: endopeptidase La [Candidatus Yanofskybacteria bacterium RIFCSPHIGHO2_12_FULL_41_9]OGN23616.1 MAG: endopeptidase La [Candidatus Yanofskybacteria bacterium RIFCSPLOWO2_01_FULL_41_67]OGN29397.1 MAG: endopeptidase La [Candidatus Yanofskybacteria bacterium RIFCSPLOWO2_02_FULL_41_13]OGN34550.1 MAG